MKPSERGWTIVLVGAWNQAIFNPSWILKYLFGEEGEHQVEIGVALGADERMFTFSDQGVAFKISPRRISIKPLELSEGVMQQANTCAENLLTRLQHTPVTAAGVNFLFTSEGDGDEFRETFSLNDGGSIEDAGLSTAETKIVRKFSGITDHGNPDLILTISRDEETLATLADFNYHYTCETPADLGAAIHQSFLGLKAHAESVLQAFGIELEELNDDQD